MGRSLNAQRIVPCMPSLLEQEKIPLDRNKGNTKFGGTACEHAMVMFLLSQITNCAEPYVDDGVDLLVEKDRKWQRAQVKKVVFSNSLDYGMMERSGEKIYRESF